MSVKFSENQINLARKKYYGKLYFNDNLNIIKIIINKILILFFKTKVFTINIKRKIFSFFLNSLRVNLKVFTKLNVNLI